jgi:8-oxo-dGTP pyrophosphatase MutT (NUDIX family)
MTKPQSIGPIPTIVDVFLLRRRRRGWDLLTLQRAAHGTRCPNAWEVVHGRIEPGERAEVAAMREVAEETGLTVSALYNVTVTQFYLQSSGLVHVAVAFAGIVEEGFVPALSSEHQGAAWRSLTSAKKWLAWPREREACDHIAWLLRDGTAGAVEDVLRITISDRR